MDVITVRLASSVRPRPCDPAGHELEVGESCLVDYEGTVEFGTVVAPVFANPHYAASARLPRLLRRATVEDEEAFSRKAIAERDATAYCRERIAERRLAMKLGKVEQQLDGRKLTFHFTSEGRVDFRDLVRDLAARFHTRVELRQIGDREDAGMRGGMGPCGHSLCCSSFLKKFDPISIKMAKSQGLSLNPSKISGMCGRLMCCLKYEYDPDARPPKKGGGCSGCSVKNGPATEGGPPGGLPVVS